MKKRDALFTSVLNDREYIAHFTRMLGGTSCALDVLNAVEASDRLPPQHEQEKCARDSVRNKPRVAGVVERETSVVAAATAAVAAPTPVAKPSSAAGGGAAGTGAQHVPLRKWERGNCKTEEMMMFVDEALLPPRRRTAVGHHLLRGKHGVHCLFTTQSVARAVTWKRVCHRNHAHRGHLRSEPLVGLSDEARARIGAHDASAFAEYVVRVAALVAQERGDLPPRGREHAWMQQVEAAFPHCHIFLIVEGERKMGLEEAVRRQLQVQAVFRNWEVRTSKNEKESAELLVSLHDSLCEEPYYDHDAARAETMLQPSGKQSGLQGQLQQITGVSSEKAFRIAAKYKSMEGLMSAYVRCGSDGEREGMLRTLDDIGDVISRRVWRVLSCDEPERLCTALTST